MNRKKIIIIDDDAELTELLKSHIDSFKQYQCKGIYFNAVDFLEDKMIKDIDIVLLDLAMPGIDGLKAINLIQNKFPDVAIVVNSVMDDENVILKAIQEGAVGYIDKQNFYIYFEYVIDQVCNEGAFMTPKIAKKLFSFFQRKSKLMVNLTSREKQIAQSIINGNSYKMIAFEMNISLDTVRMHIRNIYRKFQINSKAELINVFKGFNENPSI